MTRTQYITLLDELHLAAKRVAKLRNAEIQENAEAGITEQDELDFSEGR